MNTELDLLGLPDVPRVVLNGGPLVLALCQVRFSSMLGVTDSASLLAFQRAIESNYPIAVPAQEVQLFVGIEANNPDIRHEQYRSPQWQFTDQDDNWKVVLSQDFLGLETRNYILFDEFLTRLQEALDALVQSIQPTVVTRLGLRYINEIRSNSLQSMDWFDVIRPELLGPLAVPELAKNTTQIVAMQQLLLRYPEDVGVNVNHGLIPSGTTVRLRQQDEMPAEAFYLLDFDVFREFPLPRAMKVDTLEICRYVERYHKLVYRLFRWSVTEQYIAMLKE